MGTDLLAACRPSKEYRSPRKGNKPGVQEIGVAVFQPWKQEQYSCESALVCEIRDF